MTLKKHNPQIYLKIIFASDILFCQAHKENICKKRERRFLAFFFPKLDSIFLVQADIKDTA